MSYFVRLSDTSTGERTTVPQTIPSHTADLFLVIPAIGTPTTGAGTFQGITSPSLLLLISLLRTHTIRLASSTDSSNGEKFSAIAAAPP